MALNNRAIIPKGDRNKDKKFVESYSKSHHDCEPCGSTKRLETHHIGGKQAGSNSHWNLIRLCHECHFKATDHASEGAFEENVKHYKYKIKIGETKLSQLPEVFRGRIDSDIRILVNQLKKSMEYIMIITGTEPSSGYIDIDFWESKLKE